MVVADIEGVPVYLRRLDGASVGSYNVAMRKAATVAATGLTTAVYGQRPRGRYRTAGPRRRDLRGRRPNPARRSADWGDRDQRRAGGRRRADLPGRGGRHRQLRLGARGTIAETLGRARGDPGPVSLSSCFRPRGATGVDPSSTNRSGG